jgi:hypothetical protein
VTDDYFVPPRPPAGDPHSQGGTPYQPQQHSGWVPPRATHGPQAPSGEYNAMAIVSLALAVMGFGPIAAVVGHIARKQLRERGERGDGLALAGVVIGWISTAVYVLFCGFGGVLAVAGA